MATPLWEQQVTAKGFNPSDFKFFPFMEDAIGSDGLIGGTSYNNFDQGDTLNREGHLATAAQILHDDLKVMSDNEYAFIKERYLDVLSKLQDPSDPSNFSRTIVPRYWGSRYNCMSRDQMTPNLIAIGENGVYTLLFRVFFNHLWRRALLFTTNTRPNWSYPGTSDYKWTIPDLTALSYWNIYLRSLPYKLGYAFYPLICLFDLDTFVNSIIKVTNYGKDPEHTDDIQHIAILTQAHYKVPTPISALAHWIYKKWREFPSVTYIPAEAGYANEKNNVQAVLNAYYREAGNDPLLNEVWRPIVSAIFS